MDIEYSAWRDGKFVTVPPMDELCAILKEKFEAKEQRIAYLEKENEHLKSEHYKDDEIKQLKEENKRLQEDYWRGFPISKEEEKAIDDWWKKHREEKHNGNTYSGAIGGSLEYRFIPTSIGTIGEVVCSCGEKFCFCTL